MRIGIPNTLFAAYHLAYWSKFLSLLEMEVVLSAESNAEMARLGGKMIPSEFCIPMKVFMGHVIDLMERKVDLILIPRMRNQGNRNFFCPKLIGLPEIVRYSIGLEETGLLSPEIVCNGLHLKMTKPPAQRITPLSFMKQMEHQANIYWENTLSHCLTDKLTLPEAVRNQKAGNGQGRITLGLLGYAYSLYDPFISKGLIHKLVSLGATVQTWEMTDPGLIEKRLKGLKRPLFWNFGRIILGTGLYFLESAEIDGIIFATTFGCGPDSVATKILSLQASNHQKPLLLLNLDEHTEDGHLRTRLEAFVDMLVDRKEGKAV